MLVLTRKQQEKIQIGDNIVITVLRTKGKTVRLGIEAPHDVTVLRGELIEGLAHEDDTELEPTDSGQRLQATALKTDTPPAPGASNSMPAPGSEPKLKCNTDAKPQVFHGRMTRSRVATVLPQVLGEAMQGGRGPLRAMLDRRGEAVI